LRKLALALALIIAIVSVPSLLIAAPVSANIVINNVPYFPQNPLQNVNDRLLLPFREISEAIGADVQWDGDTRRILTTFGNRYSIMHINQSQVTYGTFIINDHGELQFTDSRTMLLDVSPQLIGNFTYIPLRAFVETLGAEVNWVANTSTAHITAVPPSAPPVTTPPTTTPPTDTTPPAAARPPNFGDFSNTSFFRLMSSSAVRNMYMDSNNNPFVVVIYDSSLESSKYIVPNIQDAAQSSRFMVHGVDMANENNREQDNVWLWVYFRQAQFQDPTVYFVHRRGLVRQIQAPTDMDALEDAFVRFRSEVDTGIAFGDFTNTAYFVNRSDQFIAREIDDRNEFIVVLYDPSQPASGYYVPIIKAAAARRQIPVHGLDVDRHPNFDRNISWFRDFRDHPDLPIMILVYENRNDMRYYAQPINIDRAVSHINEFVSNRATTTVGGFPDMVIGENFFRNANINNLRVLYEQGEEFLILIYDSSNQNYRAMVEAVAREADSASSNHARRVYGVNRSSSVFSQNHTRSNFDWLGLGTPLQSITSPILVRVTRNQGNIIPFPANPTAHRTSQTLIDQMWVWLHGN